MKELEKHISPLIEQMFPAFYREEGQGFISFVKAYYEWMESSNNALYHSRRMPDYADIDTTLDEFIVNFKEKYLKNIQFDVASNKQLFVKNALDFYRAKGSERAIDLFFRLIYGRSAEVYYPGDDIFRLSEGEWFEPVYLEVTRTDKNPSFVGKQITGTISGATGFVDRLVRRRKDAKYIDIFYISNIMGNFQTGEVVKYNNDIENNPKVTGSFNTTTIVSGGGNFTVGETVQFTSNNGIQGKAYVNSVANVTGIVDFNIVDGGFGYNSDSIVLVSNVNLELGNVVRGNTSSKVLFDRFETVTQKLANISFDTANSTSTFTSGEYIYTYYANSMLAGTAEILSISQDTGAANGNIFVAISGNLQSSGNLYSSGNTKVANMAVYTSQSATANIIAYASNVSIYTTDTVGSYGVGEEIYQANSLLGEWANGVIKSVTVSVTNTVISVQNVNGVFLTGIPILGRVSGATANLYSYNNKIGVVDITNTFYTSKINSVTTSSSNNNATLVRKNAGNNATFKVGNTIYTESNTYNSDFINSNNHYSVQFNTATTDLYVGTQIYRYYSNGVIASRGSIVAKTQTSGNANGYLTVYRRQGNSTAFSPWSATNVTNTFYTSSNLQSAVIVSSTPQPNYYGNIALSSLTFGFPKDPTANITNYNATTYQVQKFFNANTAVNATAEFITIANNYWANDTALTYLVATGNTALTNLSNNSQYYVVGGNSTGVSLATSIGGTAINLTKGLTQSGHSLTTYYPTSVTFNANSAVDATNDFISIPFNQFTNNTLLLYSVATGNTAVNSLAPGASYYVVNANSSGVSLSSVISGNKIDLTKGLTQTGHTLTLSSVLANILEYETLTVGRISTLSSINSGNLYSDSPFVVVFDPRTYGFYKSDYYITYTGATGNILEGELIVGQTSEARALVKTVNSTVITATRLNMWKQLTGNEVIRGQTSAANVTSVYVQDLNSYAGLNAIIPGNAISTNGSVTSLRVIDSGIGYVDGETATFYSTANTDNVGLALLNINNQGIAEGRYNKEGGFLDAAKYIHDGEYYQEFSYEVIVSLPFEKYSDMFKKVVHVAGTKLFGKYISIEVANAHIQAANVANSITLST